MSEPVCERCSGTLPTGTERKVGQCVACLLATKEELASLQTTHQETVTKLKTIQENAAVLVQSIERRKKLDEAERLGSKAALDGADEGENPYVKGSEEHILWESGFVTSSLTNEYDQFRAMLLWSLNVLDHIEELARGYGQEEIAVKVATVLEKYAQHFPELLEEKEKQESQGKKEDAASV